jgi:hypothetical protein
MEEEYLTDEEELYTMNFIRSLDDRKCPRHTYVDGFCIRCDKLQG